VPEWVRHDNTAARAQAILRKVIKNHPMTLRIQHELVDEKKDISETGAAVELDRQMAELIQKHKKDLVEIQKEMATALAEKDEETRKELDAVRRDLEANVEKISKDRERLAGEYEQVRKEAQERMNAMRQDLDREKSEREANRLEYERLQREYERRHDMSQAQQATLMQQIQEMKNRPIRRSGFFESLGNAVGALFTGRF